MHVVQNFEMRVALSLLSGIGRGCIWRETKIPALVLPFQAAEEKLHSQNKCQNILNMFEMHY
jgi:hypothetical protein